jgi:cysteine desulfurase
MPAATTGYLDYNATAPMRPAVAAAMAAALGEVGNPSSVHRFGRLARQRVEEARAAVAALVGARPEQVVFTSGGTEANNLALAGVGRPAVVSAIEHDSVLRAAPAAARAPVHADGTIKLDALDDLLGASAEPAVVSVMLANNETGVIQPVATAAALARAHGALVHCDAVQAPGRIRVDFDALGVDMMSLSAHKLGGPQGVGALIVADHVTLAPSLRGGGQERHRRAGTENVAGVVGFACAAEAAIDAIADMARLGRLRDRLEQALSGLAPDLVVFGKDAPRLANTSCLTMPGVAAETQVMALDLAGVAVSAGSACSSGKVAPSHVLAAMGANHAQGGRSQADQAIRVSLGWATVDADIDHMIDAWGALFARAGAGSKTRTAA